MLPGKSLLKSPPPKDLPKIAATPRSVDRTVDMKKLVPAVALIASAAALAIWAISRAFAPGTVTRLERHMEDMGPPAPPPKPVEAQRSSPPAAPQKATAITPQADVAPAAPAAEIPTSRPVPPRPPGSVIPVASVSSARVVQGPHDPRLPPPELRFETFEQVVDASVYTARDRDVDPPVVLYPQQLGRVPIGAHPEDVAYVEVTVNEDGSVAGVKATNSPQTLDVAMVLTMSLSAAKTWRFQPARKEGRAVRYRHVLPVSLR